MIKKIFSYSEILPGPLVGGGYSVTKSHLIDWTRLAPEWSDWILKRLYFTYTVKDRIKANIFNN